MAEGKFYKLGKKATLFYDAATGFKLVDKQIAEASASQRKSSKFRKAVKEGHIKETTKPVAGQEQEDDEDEAESKFISLAEFKKMTVQPKKDYLTANFPDEDEDEIDELTGPELNDKFEELVAKAESGDDEDEDEDDE